jgi:hypothetical protein
MEQALKVLQNNLKQKDEQIEIYRQKLQTLSSERGEMIKMIDEFLKIMKATTGEPAEDQPNEVPKNNENWDLLGQDSGKYNYYVKYTAPEESKIPIESVEPSGWNSTTKPELTTSDSKKSWGDIAEEAEESKNDFAESNVVVDPIDEQLGKNVYVIFDGPMKGIYSNWAIAKLHIDGKNVRHKAYPTMEKAKAAYNSAYKEITNSIDMVQPSTMEVKKKVSVDTILNLERLKNKEKTFDDFIGKWRWLTSYKEELALECFYPVNIKLSAKANTVPGISKELLKDFYDMGLLKTVYLEEEVGRRFQELSLLPKEIGDIAKRFNDLFAKGKEIFLQFEQTYPWYDPANNIMATGPRTVIKIGISNKTYLPANLESIGWSAHSFIYQMKRFYDNLIRYGSSITNFKVLYSSDLCLMVCDSKKKVTDEHLKQVLHFEDLFSGFDQGLYRIPEEVQKECCLYFQKYKGHMCKWCASSKVSALEDKAEEKA